jgi:hypothetical protein
MRLRTMVFLSLLLTFSLSFAGVISCGDDDDDDDIDDDTVDDDADDDIDDDVDDDLNDDIDDDVNDDTDDDCVECDSDEYCENLFGWEWTCFDDCCVEEDIEDKPVIYLYPETTLDVSVTLVLDANTDLIWSWPLYGNGWNISVRPDGLIDGLYPYLYYEAAAPNVHDYGIYQFTEGLIVSRDDLFDRLESYLLAVGFQGREVGDFLLYWTQELPEFAWYAVYPQFTDIIRNSVDLVIDPAPDSLLRLWLIFEGYDDLPAHLDVTEPVVESFHRSGFTAVEWGVIQAFE